MVVGRGRKGGKERREKVGGGREGDREETGERERKPQPPWEQGSRSGECQKSVAVEGLNCKEGFPGDNLNYKKRSAYTTNGFSIASTQWSRMCTG